MNLIKILWLWPVALVLQSVECLAQADPKIYKIVWVMGKPLRNDKSLIKDGQKIDDKERLLFTTMKDVVIVLNDRFDRIYMKPKNLNQLKKPVKVSDFAQGNVYSGGFGSNLNLRSIKSGAEFQSFLDTLKLHITDGLKIKIEEPISNFSLLDQNMEQVIGAVKFEEGHLLIIPPGLGSYTLHLEKGRSKSETLAEIEFLNINAIKAELKFVYDRSQNPDSTQSNQVQYLKKFYPRVPGSQISRLTIQK